MKNLFKALAEFQQECPVIKKERNNDFGKFKYTDLTDVVIVIKPLLKNHGLGYYQSIESDNLKTVIFHIESGETIESNAKMELHHQLKGMNQYQVAGSAISYFRKYSLCALLGIVSDERSLDDTQPNEKKQKPKFPQDRFENGLTKVGNGELTAEAFKKALEGFELTELQTAAIKLI
jgi:hypothetical protein